MSFVLAPDAVIAGRYRLDRQLGEGGFGTVWQANELETGRTVAVKVLRTTDEQALRRFSNEAQALGRLAHVNVVALLDYGQLADGKPYIVTEYVRGTTLTEWSRVTHSVDELIEVARQIGAAIEHAHVHQISHRDLKPDNVMLVEGASLSVKVLDFGLAKLTATRQTDVTKTGEVMGTPGFMSPEQLRARPDVGSPSDVYSFGVLLFQLFERRHPFEGQTMLELAMNHLTKPAPAIDSPISGHLVALVAAMLAKSPARRPAMGTVCRVLDGEPFDATTPEKARPLRFERVDHAPSRRSMIAVGATILVVGGCALAVASLLPRESVGPSKASTQRAAPRGLLKGYAAPDGPTPPKSPSSRSSGCGLPSPGAGVGVSSKLDGVDVRTVAWRVPPGYDPNVAAPVLIMLHDVAQTSADMFKLRDLEIFSAERGFITIAPLDPDPLSTWLRPNDYVRAARDFEVVASEFCIDLDRVFVFGHGNGGLAADVLACTLRGVRAVATTSHRLWGDLSLCLDKPAVPRLFISSMDDPFAPVSGGTACMDHFEKWPLAVHERELRMHHQCAGADEAVDEEGGRCETPTCAVPLTLCRAEGGRYWAEMPSPSLPLNFGCVKPAGTFGFGRAISAFFAAEHEIGPP